jgi:hypothetical protein
MLKNTSGMLVPSREAFIRWLTVQAIGLIPLFAHFLSYVSIAPANPAQAGPVLPDGGFASDFLVNAIVVSAATILSLLQAGEHNHRLKQQILLGINLYALVGAAILYALVQSSRAGNGVLREALYIAGVALVASLYLDMSSARPASSPPQGATGVDP